MALLEVIPSQRPVNELIRHIGSREPGSGGPVTILNFLDYILSSNQTMHDIYDLTLQDELLADTDIKPSFEQVNVFFSSLRKGFVYLKDKYGDEALPTNFSINNFGANLESAEPFSIGYWNETDMLTTTPYFIAVCANNIFPEPNNAHTARNDHMEEGQFVSMQDAVTLVAVEEGYHRYAKKVLHIPDDPKSTPRPQRISEQTVRPIVRLAMSDLEMPVYDINGTLLG